MKKSNVIDLNEFKEQKEIKRTEENYGSYLKTLANSQLEGEVHYLLEEFSQDLYGKDFFSRGKLILKEIRSRAHLTVKTKIDKISEETLKLL